MTEFRHQQAARQYMLDLEAHAAALKASNLEIADLNRHLDHKVAARTRELQQMVAVAEAALKTKSTFMAAITHEIKTPIHHVYGHARARACVCVCVCVCVCLRANIGLYPPSVELPSP